MPCRYPQFPAGLGFIYPTEICAEGLGFSSPGRQSCTKMVLLLCASSGPTLEMCTSQLCVCFPGREQRLAEHPIPKEHAAHSDTARGLCDTSWIIHEPSAPRREMPFIKHTSCWIITAPINNPPCTYCPLQKTQMRGIVRGEQSAALFSRAPRWPRGLVRSSELFARPAPVGRENDTAPLPQTAPRLPSAQPQGPAAEWMQLETIQPLHSRPLWRPRPPNAHMSDFLEAHGECSQSDGTAQRFIHGLQ